MTQLASPLLPPRARQLYCNRTLTIKAIRAIGYDMDYTLIHYRVQAWEERAYEHLRRKLLVEKWPVEDLRFDPDFVIRGLIIDKENGNILKANRFGFVRQAYHGTRPLDFDEQRRIYSRTIVDLADRKRFDFLNTFFSLSEGCMYAQLVDLLDAGMMRAALREPTGYAELYQRVHARLDEAHMEGELKKEIAAAPERFVELDADTPLALLDQKHAGKQLMLITNSEWEYTRTMMAWAFDRFLPSAPTKMTWRDLFDVIVVGARKPDFFQLRAPLFEVVSEDGLLKPVIGGLRRGGVFLGGSAPLVEQLFGLVGDEVLYVGDLMYGDVHVSKSVQRWRTALIVRELESEIAALEAFAPRQAQLSSLMEQKEAREFALNRLQLALLRQRDHYGEVDDGTTVEQLERQAAALRAEIAALDAQVVPLVKEAAQLGNQRWGLLLRTGNDKSHLARQIERHADCYTSRVSNFLFRTPLAYLRPPRQSLPHDP